MLRSTHTIANDEKKYRSEFEASFVNRFLHNKFDYEYEKRYDEETRFTCDFYLKDLDLWVECCYKPFAFCNTATLHTGRINLICGYNQRHVAKRNGAKWDKDRKTWYLPKTNGSARWIPKSLLKFIPEDIEFINDVFLYGDEVVTEAHKDQELYDYVLRIAYKVTKARQDGRRLILVDSSMMSSTRKFADLVRMNNPYLYKELFVDEYEATRKRLDEAQKAKRTQDKKKVSKPNMKVSKQITFDKFLHTFDDLLKKIEKDDYALLYKCANNENVSRSDFTTVTNKVGRDTGRKINYLIHQKFTHQETQRLNALFASSWQRFCQIKSR